MYFETERLIITDVTLDMAEPFQRNSLDEDNRQFVPDEVFETIEDAKETLTFLINAYASKEGPFVYALLTKEKENIGYVQACTIKEGFEVGYHIAKPFTGHGYATEAVKAFVPKILEQLEIDKLYGVVLEENKASHKVLEKAGFKLVYQGIGRYQHQDRALRRYLYEK